MKIEDQNHYQVNWINGMKINKEHFIEAENAFTQRTQLMNSKNINEFNYGLLPQTGLERSIEMSLSIDGQGTVKIQLQKCSAITSGGHLIYITKEISELLERNNRVIETDYKIEGETEACYIIISVNPYQRIPLGDSLPNEEPPRHPFVIPEYKLSIVPKSETNDEELGKYHITLGKIRFDETTNAELAEEFIPPCTSIQSHPDLIHTYQEIGVFYNRIENYSMLIIQKIYQKKQSNELAKMVLTLSQSVLQYIGGMLSEYRLNDKYAHPVVLISKLMSLARVIKNNLDVYNGTGKEELLNYLSDWCDLNQGAFENTLIDLIELQYQHTDINTSLNHVSEFTRLMHTLFKKLSELDYIGKKLDPNIFVKEEVIAEKDSKPRRSFLWD
ncbi:hypothetical protein [Ascidiimonas sp. W6]|uniref:hypothetical protein n=1 Tax=Ascidiimonas meishanensis TaxID=3128903 RepID=UPI0030EB4069